MSNQVIKTYLPEQKSKDMCLTMSDMRNCHQQLIRLDHFEQSPNSIGIKEGTISDHLSNQKSEGRKVKSQVKGKRFLNNLNHTDDSLP